MAIGKVYGIKEEKQLLQTVTFNITPEDATFILKDKNGKTIEPETGTTYKLEERIILL